jgi:glycosyltransferase involved in cell wall biosynthesis
MVGRFDQRKGADLALQAMEIVCRQEPRARLTLVGPDSGIEVGGRKRKFEEYCREHLSPAARASIRFLGSVGPQELSELRLDSLAALLCSRWENLSYALTEAMAMGCPIVTTRSHEDDVVKHGETALVAQRSDPQILANHMLLLMKKPALAQVLGQNAFAQCVRLYSPPVVADTTLAFYREVLMFSDDPRRWHSPKSNP